MAAGVEEVTGAEVAAGAAGRVADPVAEAGAQATRRKAEASRKNPESIFRIATRFNGPGHPGVVGRSSFGNRFQKAEQRTAGGAAKSEQPDRPGPRQPRRRHIRIGSIKCEIGLVKLADGIPVIPKNLAALVHVGLGFLDLASGKQLIHMNTGGMHFCTKIKGGHGRTEWLAISLNLHGILEATSG